MTIPIGHPRQAAKISSTLQRNLSMYAVAAGAACVQMLALAQLSEAEVVYTPAHVLILQDHKFAIDLNHDGIDDFTIHNRFKNLSGYLYFQLKVGPDHGGSIIWSPPASGARALFQGSGVGPKGDFRAEGQVMAFRSGPDGAYSYGSWLEVSNRYLGLKFKIDGQVHYGWARLSTKSSRGSRIVALLTGYAYETEADKPIIAGDTGGVADDAANHELQPQFIPASGVPSKEIQPSAPSLGVLAYGAQGLEMWRRELN
jgi:hypothetical protein